MKKFYSVLLAALVASSAIVSLCAAEDVFVTKNGKKFHNAESRFIKGKETTKLTLEDAQAKGYEPSKAYLDYKKSLEAKLAPEAAQAKVKK